MSNSWVRIPLRLIYLIMLLIIYTFILLKDYYNYTTFKHLIIFKIIKNYYLIKYKNFIIWKNSVYFLFLLNIYFKKYYIFSFFNLLLISLGFSFFFLNYYDYLHMKELDLTDPLYKNLEPSFNVADSNLTNEIKYDKIQKNGNFYSFLFL